MTHLIHINTQAFAVSDEEIDMFEARLLEAVHSSGAFVDFVGAGERPVRILVGPATWVWIEKLAQIEEFDEGEEDGSDVVVLDLDL